MTTVDLSQASPEVLSLIELARDDDIVVRMADGSEFLVVAVGDFDLEVAKTRANTKLMNVLESRARQTVTIPLDEVKRRLGL